MSKSKTVERDGGNCAAQAQADGDPGYSRSVYVDRRGMNRSADRYEGEGDRTFCEIHGLAVCVDCKKFCEPVLTEERREPFAPRTEAYFCYNCDFNGRVRMLVEEGLADLDMASRIVHRLIAFEHPGAGVERVTVTR
jgi:hypothetical protein